MEGSSIYGEEYIKIDTALTDTLHNSESGIEINKVDRRVLGKRGIKTETLDVFFTGTTNPVDPGYILIEEDSEGLLYLKLEAAYSEDTLLIDVSYDHWRNLSISLTYDPVVGEVQKEIELDRGLDAGVLVKKTMPFKYKVRTIVYLKDFSRRVAADQTIRSYTTQYFLNRRGGTPPYQSNMVSLIESIPEVHHVRLPLEGLTLVETIIAFEVLEPVLHTSTPRTIYKAPLKRTYASGGVYYLFGERVFYNAADYRDWVV